MKFSDIVDLAKAGYKPSDIKELLTLTEPKEVESDPVPEKEPDVDYKAMYEAEKKKLEELQDKNSREPVDPEPLKIDEIIKSVKKSIS